MKPVSLNEYLSAENAWTSRLVTDESGSPKTRDAALIDREYNLDLYGRRLEAARRDLEGFRTRSLFGLPSTPLWASIADEIYHLPSCMFIALKRQRILEIVERFCGDEALCELGAGNGQNLIWLQHYQRRRVYGGEYSANAVELGRLLGLELSPFNYYEPGDYDLIKDPSSVLTVHSIEQIPDATVIVDSLRARRDRLRTVVHFEPVFNHGRQDLLGRLRNRYARLNDYNVNLLEVLEMADDITILHRELDVLGNNPLNPSSILVWRFV